ARTIGQRCRTATLKSSQPFITDGRTDLETPAQLSNVRVGLNGQTHKLKSHSNHVFHSPRHSYDTLPAPPDMCPPCPRTPVHYVPGPYTFLTGREGKQRATADADRLKNEMRPNR